MTTPGTIDDTLVRAIYDTALCEGRWSAALERFRCLLNSAEGALTIFSAFPTTVAEQHSSGHLYTGDLRERYVRYYGRYDPKSPIMDNHPAGFVFNDVEHFDPDFVRHDRFYQEFTIPMGLRHTLLSVLRRDSSGTFYLAANRTSQQGPFDISSRELFRQASDHFLRALALRDRVSQTQTLARNAEATLDRLGYGVIVLNEKGRIVLANAFARNAMGPGCELRAVSSQLSARSAETGRTLDAMLARALAGYATAAVVRISCQKQGQLLLWSVPLRASTMLVPGDQPGVLLFLRRAEARPQLIVEHLRALYGLTDAEARLAIGLCEGATLSACAARRGVKLSTVRTQLLSVLSKMGLHRQSDVVRILSDVAQHVSELA